MLMILNLIIIIFYLSRIKNLGIADLGLFNLFRFVKQHLNDFVFFFFFIEQLNFSFYFLSIILLLNKSHKLKLIMKLKCKFQLIKVKL